MTQREIDILKIEEDFKDTIENSIVENNSEKKELKIKDVKFIGEITWNDKINKRLLSDYVFLVDVEIYEIDINGEKRVTELEYCYLGNKIIGGTLGNNPMLYNKNFEMSEPYKLEAVKEILEKTPMEEVEKNSLINLRIKEAKEILSAYFERDLTEEEIQELEEFLENKETNELIEEYENEDQNVKKDYNENKLSKKQSEKIKVKGIQKADLNKKVDGKETLGKRLDLEEYDNLYVVYSEDVKEISKDAKVNDTRYSLIGMTKDGEAKVLNDEFEMDNTVGNNGSREQTKIRANSTATRDNRDSSVYRRKSNGMSVGCENDKGYVNMFLYGKTFEENENVGIQIETSQTRHIPIKTREVMNRNKGIYQKDKVQNEIKEHIDNECEIKDVKDFDGDENTASHVHVNEEKINENDYIPNTNMTYREFANKCGYRGEGSIEKIIQVINEFDEVNNETVNQYIEDIEEEYNHIKDKNIN